MDNYSILVNTCDKFEDCWDPFFKLFQKYWPDYGGKIYLNSEHKSYSYPGLRIVSLRNSEGRGIERATWSQCLRWALEAIPEEIVLYMQEDYFIKDGVRNDIIDKYVGIMRDDPTVMCIHLTDQSVLLSGESQYENLENVQRHQRYRVSCQAALWRKDELIRLLRDYESAWEFEEFGSKRSSVLGHRYLAVSHSFVRLGAFEILPYIFTGIVQGRWYEPTRELFDANGIDMDWDRRGFLGDAPGKPFWKRVRYCLHKIPVHVRSYCDICKLKRSLNDQA